MTMLPNVFDPTQHSPATGPTGGLPISPPTGHLVVITDSVNKQTADKTGSYLELTLEVREGEHAGATGAYRLNIDNQSADAVRIALSQLSALCYVCGHLAPLQDVSVLYEKPFRVIVVQQNTPEGREKGYTEVKEVRDVAGNKPGQQTQAATAAAAPVAPATPTPQPPVAQAAPATPGESQPQPAANPQAAPWANPPS